MRTPNDLQTCRSYWAILFPDRTWFKQPIDDQDEMFTTNPDKATQFTDLVDINRLFETHRNTGIGQYFRLHEFFIVRLGFEIPIAHTLGDQPC